VNDAVEPVSEDRDLAAHGLGWEFLGEAIIGYGAVAWLEIGPCDETLAPPGEIIQALKIHETGNVPELEIENPSDRDAVILAHAVFAGGLQTRAAERSVIVAR